MAPRFLAIIYYQTPADYIYHIGFVHKQRIAWPKRFRWQGRCKNIQEIEAIAARRRLLLYDFGFNKTTCNPKYLSPKNALLYQLFPGAVRNG